MNAAGRAMRRWIDLALAGALVLGAPAAAQDFGVGMPRAASDWLAGKAPPPPAPVSAWRPGESKPADAQRRRSAKPPPARPAQTAASRSPVATTASVPRVGVTRLAEGNPDTKGVIPAGAAGLPRDLWGPASAADLSQAIAAAQPRLQATRALLVRMLAAQLAPPSGSAPGDEGRLFLARLDRLIGLGLLDEARALLQSAGVPNAEVFSRSFDLAMYEGDAAPACAQMAQRPGLAPGLAARVYCLARAGDWSAAALTLRGARQERLIPDQTLALLERFLDDSSADLGDTLPDPRAVTPLEFRLFEAIGQPLATGDLPVAFAWADLGPEAGWKAQIEAAERLARAGAIDPARLAAAYAEQKPAASGGVWDRAALYQRLDTALVSGDTAALSSALVAVEPAFARPGLLAALARLIAPRLPAAALDGPAAEAAAHLRLLAAIPVPGAARLPEADRALVNIVEGPPAVAGGAGAPVTPDPAPATSPAPSAASGSDPSAASAPPPSAAAAPEPDASPALSSGQSGTAPYPAAAFPAGSPGAAFAGALSAAPLPQAPPEGRGMALLRAMADAEAGLDGDVQRAAAGLRRLSELGQPDVARRAAVELLLADHLGLRR